MNKIVQQNKKMNAFYKKVVLIKKILLPLSNIKRGR